MRSITDLFRKHGFAIAVLLLAFAGVADASTVGAVQQVPTVAWVRTHNLSSFPAIKLAGFATDTDRGGGVFTKVTVASCPGSTDDGGVTICDSAGNVFRRSFSGAVSLKWYGAPDATSTAWVGASGTLNCITNRQSCDASALATKAFTAALAYGNGEVTTDQRSVVFWSNVDLPANTKLTCGTQHGGPLQISSTGYWTQKGSIVLKVSGASYASIRPGENTELSGCAYIIPSWLIPGWYNDNALTPATPTLRSLVAAMRLRLGTAIISEGASANARELTVVGFDVCHDISQSPRAVIDQFYGDCNILHYNHDQEVGANLSNSANGVYMIFRGLHGCWAWVGATCTQEGAIQRAIMPIVGMVEDATAGEIKITTSNSSVYMQPTNLSVGDRITLRIGDSKLQLEADPPSELVSGSLTLLNVGLISATGPVDTTVEYIELGDNVYDRSASSCIPADTKVVSTVANANGSLSVTMDKAATCSATFRNIVFESESTAPPGAGGLRIIKSISGNDIVLLGTSWAGPTYTSASWVLGASAIAVSDTTNIKAGQYIVKTTCAAPPYCPAADLVAGWTFAPTTVTGDPNSVLSSTTAVGTITIGSNANWPVTGTVLIDTEEMAYRMASSGSSTSLVILTRGVRGTNKATHIVTAAVTAAAPIVTAIVASQRPDEVSSYVIVGSSGVDPQAANAIASGSGTVRFANSTRVTTGIIGSINVAPDYRYWSAMAAAGPVPRDVLQTTGTGTAGTTSVTLAHGCHKVFRGMTIRASDGSTSVIPAGTTVANDPTTCAITTSQSLTGAGLSSTNVIIDGCGYPSATTAWAGNCTGVSVLLTAATIDDNEGGVQGWVGTRITVGADRVSFKFDASPALLCVNLISAGGGKSGSQFDDGSIGFWFDRIADAAQCTTGMAKGKFTTILNTATKANDGITLDGFLVGPNQIAIANLGLNSNLTITGMHTKDVTRIFAHSEAETQVFGDNDMPNTEIVTNDPASWQANSATRSIYCSNNVFRVGTPCSSVGTSSTPLALDTVAQIRAGSFSAQATAIVLGGYTAAGDGGGGTLAYVTSGTDDGIETFCSSPGNRCFKRAQGTPITAQQGGAYCNAQKFNALGSTTAGSTTINTGTHQAPADAVGRTIVLPTSGGTTFYPGNTVTVTNGGTSGYAVNDTVTLTGGTFGAAAVLKVSAVDGSGIIAAVRWLNRAAYGNYSVIPSNPVSQGSTSGAGVGTPTFTLTWQGNTPLVTTITAVGTNTLTLAAAPTVTQSSIPVWAYGNLDATRIQAYIDWAEAKFGVPVIIDGLCMVEARIDMPASTVNAATMFGQGTSASGLLAGATMVNLVRRTAPFGLAGGGIRDMMLDGMTLTSGAVLSVSSGSDISFSALQVLNAAGSTNWNIEDTGGTNGPKWTNIRARYESGYTGARAPQYNFKATGEAGTYFMIDATGAADVQFYFDTRGNASYIHTQSPGGLPAPNYGVQVANGGMVSHLDIDGAIIAGLYVNGRYSTVSGGNINCGNDAAFASTYGVLLATTLKDATITGFSFDSDCAWSAANKIALAGTVDQNSRVFGNSGASFVQLYAPGTVVPQGRLSCSSITPVMAADVASCTTVYYLPYIGNRVPSFAGLAASSVGSYLTSYNIGSGMSLALDPTTGHTNDQAANAAYDIYQVVNNSGTHFLCSGTGWTASTQGSATSITRTGSEDLARDSSTGLWVNAEEITNCRHSASSGDTLTIGINQGVYLGTLWATANGVTTMTFAPAAASGGSNAILALYNAYNKTIFAASSRDTAGRYAYVTGTLRPLNGSGSGSGLNNRVSWLDGLGDVHVRAQLTTVVESANGSGCIIGINFNSVAALPDPRTQVGMAGGSALTANAVTANSTPPILGFSYAQAMESGAADCFFGSAGYQATSWSGMY